MYMLILLAALAAVIGVNMAVTRWQKRRFNPAEAGKDKMMVGMAPFPDPPFPTRLPAMCPPWAA